MVKLLEHIQFFSLLMEVDMKIEFYTDSEVCHNVRFLGESHASNEVILGLFYEHSSKGAVNYLLKEIENALNEKLPEAEQDDFDYGDFISGKLNKEYSVLVPDGPIISKSYKLKTSNLKMGLKEWMRFLDEDTPNRSQVIDLELEAF